MSSKLKLAARFHVRTQLNTQKLRVQTPTQESVDVFYLSVKITYLHQIKAADFREYVSENRSTLYKFVMTCTLYIDLFKLGKYLKQSLKQTYSTNCL